MASLAPGADPSGAVAPDGPPVARQIVVLSLVGVVVGLLAGAGATLFVAAEHHLQELLWVTLPDSLGFDETPAWMVVGLLVVGALVTYTGLRLPGHGGHSPLSGFALDLGPRALPGVVVAALGSLAFGAVLGPEAPLMAIGTGLGALAIRDPDKPARQVMMVVGALAAVGAIFGNPLVSCVLLLEMAALSGPPLTAPPVLMAALAGMASGYILQVGLEGWSGLGESQLGLPGLAPYSEVLVSDVVVAVPVAILVATLAMAARLCAQRVAAFAARRQLAALVLAGVVVALTAVAVDALTGTGPQVVLYSGQSSMTDYLALTSVGTAVVILAGKFVAYAASLGSGFRGGAIFPAVALGVLVSTSATLIVPGTSTSALAATAIAAAAAGAMRLPFVALLLGVTMTYPAGGATTVLAVLGTIIGLAVRLGGERFAPALRPDHRPGAAPTPDAPASSV